MSVLSSEGFVATGSSLNYVQVSYPALPGLASSVSADYVNFGVLPAGLWILSAPLLLQNADSGSLLATLFYAKSGATNVFERQDTLVVTVAAGVSCVVRCDGVGAVTMGLDTSTTAGTWTISAGTAYASRLV
jgi:phosphatidylserine synthase